MYASCGGTGSRLVKKLYMNHDLTLERKEVIGNGDVSDITSDLWIVTHIL